MKRFVLGWLALLGLGGMVFAAPCTSVQSGDWTSAATWGGSACAPTASDRVTINHVVRGNFTGTVTLFDFAGTGTLNMVAGNRRFDIASYSPSQWSGTLNLANGTVLNTTANYGVPGWDLGVTGGLVSDATDLGPIRSVTNFKASGVSGVCVVGENWTVTMTPAPTGLVPGDLAQFINWDSGGFGRFFEIVAVSASAITLCPSLPDAVSHGPRLTPHKLTLAIPQPGVTPRTAPAVGDKLLAWHPWIMKRTGSARWSFLPGDLIPNTARTELVGGDISGSNVMIFRCAATQPPVILSHTNLHDVQTDIDGDSVDSIFRFREGSTPDSGCKNPLVSFSHFHDNGISEGQAEVIADRFQPGGAGGQGGAFIANTFDRTNNNNIQVNSAEAGYFVRRFEVSYNTCYELGTSGTGECSCIEVDDSSDVTVQFNRMWGLSQWCQGFARSGLPIPDYKNNLWIGNFVDGAYFGIGIINPEDQGVLQENAAINNYVAHIRDAAIVMPKAHSNLVRRWSDGNDYQQDASASFAGIWARQAEGNVMDGAGSLRAAVGIWTENADLPGVPGRYFNNAFFGLATGAFHPATGVSMGGTEVFDTQIRHNYIDCGTTGWCCGVARLVVDPPAPIRIAVEDNVSVGGAGYGATSEAGLNVSRTVRNLTRFGGLFSAGGEWSWTSGEVERDPRIVSAGSDWNYRATSQELGAGAVPAFSSIGIRGRLFDASLFPPFLLDVMGTLPVNTANDAGSDADLDLTMAFAANDSDSPDVCPALTDVMNGMGGPYCVNAVSGANQGSSGHPGAVEEERRERQIK